MNISLLYTLLVFSRISNHFVIYSLIFFLFFGHAAWRIEPVPPAVEARRLHHWTIVPVKVKVAQSCPTLRPCGLYSPWNSPGQNPGMGSLSLLQAIFPTQGLNPGLPHCRWILYQLSHKGSPRILEWVACPFSRVSSWPRNQTRVSCIAGRFFTNWDMREALIRDQTLVH